MENILLEELRDLSVRFQVLQATLGTVISLMNDTQRDTVIRMLAENLKVVGTEDPRGIAGATAKELIDYALLPASVMLGRTEEA
ncbi:hypothetical protein MKK75_17620 [Methylobacterium sp. J-030]|uniref:hypothetical protein n=1 Tax=Methylobacterium sp. J-030 TaxID=2836627 RepID=UPI001FBA00EE|nr:hypothetical protein [Methylobacterium sp. J-030]MCJ2070591.1 hypothetical protein [Methylobacterium sp. J-030]